MTLPRQDGAAPAACRYEYYHLPEVTEAQLANKVEVKLEASFNSSDGYVDWVAARPQLLLLRVGCGGRASGDRQPDLHWWLTCS